MANLLICSNQKRFIDLFTSDSGGLNNKYNVVDIVSDKDYILDTIRLKSRLIDTVIVAEGIKSSSGLTTQTVLRQIRAEFSNIRIIYLAGEIQNDDVSRINVLGMLVKEGVYDIYYRRTMSPAIIQDIIDNPKTYDDVKYLTRFLDDNVDPSQGYKNVVVVSSIKPGSGKSFLAVNMAVAIAKYGQDTYDGRRPRVAIVEGDLQTLSVGTLLQVENPKYNLRNALRAASRIITEDGFNNGSEKEIEEVEREIRSCFLCHDTIKNLYVLAGSQMSLNDLNLINPAHYCFVIESIINYFDVIIVDANSSLEHKTTAPLLELADHAYFLLDLDSNNIRNNIRYRKELNLLNIGNKVRYVLNRDLPADAQGDYVESLSYSSKDVEAAGFELVEKIPMLDISIAYNRIYNGTPVILDNLPETLNVRKSILRIANQTWHIDQSKINVDLTKKEEIKKEEKTNNKKKKKNPMKIVLIVLIVITLLALLAMAGIFFAKSKGLI